MADHGSNPQVDSDLVRRVQAGDSAAFDLLVRKYQHRVAALIGRYIRDGEPVGSQTLARHAGLDVSPATIRNILADLEDAGLLAAPHSSAGRVPTAQGYRLFVDSLLQLKPLGEGELAHLRQELPPGSGTQAHGNGAGDLDPGRHIKGGNQAIGQQCHGNNPH